MVVLCLVFVDCCGVGSVGELRDELALCLWLESLLHLSIGFMVAKYSHGCL